MARTDLHHAAWSREETRALIADGLDVNEVDNDGLTPLHMAAIKANVEAAKALLDAGAAIDPRDKWGNTPLNRAVFEDNAEDVVRLLVEHGADPTIANDHGHSPLSEARRYKADAYLAAFES